MIRPWRCPILIEAIDSGRFQIKEPVGHGQKIIFVPWVLREKTKVSNMFLKDSNSGAQACAVSGLVEKPSAPLHQGFKKANPKSVPESKSRCRLGGPRKSIHLSLFA